MTPILLLTLIVATSADTLRFTTQHDDEWNEYKLSFKKMYSSHFHEAIRRVEWEKNLQYIQKHNLEADLGQHTYRLGLNEFADLSNEEYKQMLVRRVQNVTYDDGLTFLWPNNIVLPDSVDWRNKGYVTAVKDQGKCGSCWSFSATGSLEGQHFRKTGKLVSLSEQNLVDCSRRFGNQGCNGGLPSSAFQYIQRNGGIDTEASYPYEGRDNICRFKPDAIGATVRSFMVIRPSGDEKHLQAAVASVGPISVAIDAGHRSFQFYRDGIYNEHFCSSVRLNHAVLVVGYGTQDANDYWLVKNSWNVRWGMKGYIMMSRNKGNQCGIATAATFPVV